MRPKLKRYVSIPRIVGVLSSIIGVLVFARGQPWHALLLVIAGLTLVLTKKSVGQKFWAEFLQSLKFGKKYLVIVLFDALFWAVLGIITGLAGLVLKEQVESLKSIDLQTPALLAPGVAESYVGTFKSVFATTLTTLIIYLLIMIFVYSLSRGMIWLALQDRPPAWAYFRKFFVLNLVWLVLLGVVLLFVMIAVVPRIAAFFLIILALLSIHVATIMHYRFTRTRSIAAFKDAFITGFGRFKRFAHLYCYAFLAYVVVSQVLKLATGKFLIGLSLLLMLLFMGWYRQYMNSVLRKIA